MILKSICPEMLDLKKAFDLFSQKPFLKQNIPKYKRVAAVKKVR